MEASPLQQGHIFTVQRAFSFPDFPANPPARTVLTFSLKYCSKHRWCILRHHNARHEGASRRIVGEGGGQGKGKEDEQERTRTGAHEDGGEGAPVVAVVELCVVELCITTHYFAYLDLLAFIPVAFGWQIRIQANRAHVCCRIHVQTVRPGDCS